MTKKLYIKTYGCQMNVYDTVRMHDVMKPFGYVPVESPEGADLVVLNTCHIREKAEDKVYSDLGRIRDQKKKKTDMIVAVGGCVGQAEGEEIFKRAPYVDIVLGPQTYHQLPEMVTRAIRDNGGVVELDFPQEQKFDLLPAPTSQGVSAFLSIQEGCDKFCSFCVVPYTRGAEYSRSMQAVLDEAKQIVDAGAIEITLLGQNVNAYHGANNNGSVGGLAELIDKLAQIRGLERIRYTTSHPRDMDDDLIAIHGSEKKLMPFLHLPVQSGSDSILKQMNRKHTAEHYLNIIDRLRAARPDIAFSSDFIVGFPGETDKDFDDTMELIKRVNFAQAYSFKYSPRPGTPAATDDKQIPEPVKQERLARAQALIAQQQTAFNEASIGSVLPVLFDREGKFDGQRMGKSPHMQSVHVMNAGDVHGKILDVKITGGFLNSLSGELVEQPLRKVV